MLVKVSLFDLYFKEFNFNKADEAEGIEAMFEYAGDSLDYIALYDRELAKGFAFSNIKDDATEIAIAYIHDKDGELIQEEELIGDLLDSSSREKARNALKQNSIDPEAISLIYVDGYEDYDGMKITKLLPMRRPFNL